MLASSHNALTAAKVAADLRALMAEVDAAEEAARGAAVCRALMALELAVKALRAELADAERRVSMASMALRCADGFDETRRAEEVLWAEEAVQKVLGDAMSAYVNWRI